MKKNNEKRNTARAQRRTALATKKKKARTIKTKEFKTVYPIGPSLCTTVNENGSVNYHSWNKTKQKDTLTMVAIKASAELKNQAESFIACVAGLLNDFNISANVKTVVKEGTLAGKQQYLEFPEGMSRKEKAGALKKVKAKLFNKPKVVITTEQALLNIEARKAKRAAEFEKRRYLSPFGKGHKQPSRSAAQIMAKEKADERQFKFVIQRKSSDNPEHSYDFKTDYFKALTKREAIKKVKRIAEPYKKDSSFTGIRLQDSKDNLITYHGKEKLFSNLEYAA